MQEKKSADTRHMAFCFFPFFTCNAISSKEHEIFHTKANLIFGEFQTPLIRTLWANVLHEVRYVQFHGWMFIQKYLYDGKQGRFVEKVPRKMHCNERIRQVVKVNGTKPDHLVST